MRDQLSKYLPAEDHRAILSRRKLFELAGLAVASAAIPPGMAALATARPASSNSLRRERIDRKSTRLNSSHGYISYAVFCLKKKKNVAARRVFAKSNQMTCLLDLYLFAAMGNNKIIMLNITVVLHGCTQ